MTPRRGGYRAGGRVLSELLPLSPHLLPYSGGSDDPDPPAGGFIASVAVVLRPAVGSPEFLLIRRAESRGDPWSGQIALPGGKRNATDTSLLDTAARETFEETGVALGAIGHALGRLNPMTPRSRRLPVLSVIPFVFAVPEETSAHPASPEVAEVFWSPLGRLRDEGARAVHHLRAEGTILTFPAFDLGGRVVWGMTHGILVDLLERIPG